MNQLHRRAQGVNRAYEPSARDIRRQCARIQATWSGRERDKRAGQSPRGSWEPPRIKASIVSEALDSEEAEWFLPSGTG